MLNFSRPLCNGQMLVELYLTKPETDTGCVTRTRRVKVREMDPEGFLCLLLFCVVYIKN